MNVQIKQKNTRHLVEKMLRKNENNQHPAYSLYLSSNNGYCVRDLNSVKYKYFILGYYDLELAKKFLKRNDIVFIHED